LLEQYQIYESKVQDNYLVGVSIQGMEEDVAMLAKVMGSGWLTDERLGLIHQEYSAKSDALELLNSQLGHMPYSRIKTMIGKGMTLDNKTLKALKREKCHVCMRTKNTEPAHNGHILVGRTAWVNFQTDITAMFDQASLYDNNYMMVIIDTKSEYVWDYCIKTKDQVYKKICEWLEKEERECKL
jgi:hypothetical protein